MSIPPSSEGATIKSNKATFIKIDFLLKINRRFFVFRQFKTLGEALLEPRRVEHSASVSLRKYDFDTFEFLTRK